MSIEFDDGYRAAIRDVLWLAEGRDRYSSPDVKPGVVTASHVARMLGGPPDQAWGWLPSWLWDEWSVRRASVVGAWADPEQGAMDARWLVWEPTTQPTVQDHTDGSGA